jgi:hypothetical protein
MKDGAAPKSKLLVTLDLDLVELQNAQCFRVSAEEAE